MKKVKEAELTKYLLHKQHLLEISQTNTVLKVVNDIIALHATRASTPYLSLFARMKQFQRSQLDRELYANRTLIRLETLRGTLFITSTNLAPILFQATRMPESRIMQILQTWGIPHSEYQKIAETIFAVIKDGGQPLHLIKQAMSPGLVRTLERQIGGNVARMTNVNIVLTVLMRQGKVFSEKFADPILTRHANRYALIRMVYPQLNLETLTPDEAQVQLVKRYIGTFGPVTEQDVVWWTGLGKGKIQTALGALESELLPIKIKKFSEEYIMLESDYVLMKKFKAPRTLPVLMLPYEDPYTKGYLLRRRLVQPEFEKHVYARGAANPTVLIKGKIVGTWNQVFEEPTDTITVNLFQRVGRSTKNALLDKAHSMGQMMIGKDVKVVFKTHS